VRREVPSDGDTPLPSFVVDSGYGFHLAYLLRAPETDKTLWRRVQRGLVHRFSELGADPKVAPDESRVLRLVPYANRKRWPDGVPTKMLYESEARYTLEEIADAVAPVGGTAFSRNEMISAIPERFTEDGGGSTTTIWPDGEEMQSIVERAEGHRYVFESWIKRNMRPGIHFGIIPMDGQEPAKPTLLKPGAELVALLYGWRFHFTADLDSLSMYGPGSGGVFAYVCHVIDRESRTVGQGRESPVPQPGRFLPPRSLVCFPSLVPSLGLLPGHAARSHSGCARQGQSSTVLSSCRTCVEGFRAAERYFAAKSQYAPVNDASTIGRGPDISLRLTRAQLASGWI
jgi:hypothetical protein